MAFDRWNSWSSSTLAFERFREHQTEINDLYWSFVPVASYAGYISRHSAGPTPASLFHATGPDAFRLANDVARWRKNFSDFQNWVRLGMLMSASSYFEMYVRAVVALALMSDPYASSGAPRLIDGVRLIKMGLRQDVEPQVNSCSKGEWPKRIAAFKRLFGSAPQTLLANVSELERMRRLRNRVGHGFGREIPSVWKLVTNSTSPVERLSEARAKKWLGLLFDTALSIDQMLLSGAIGEFELLMDFHGWRKLPRTAAEKRIAEAVAYRKRIRGTLNIQAPSTKFVEELITFYDAA